MSSIFDANEIFNREGSFTQLSEYVIHFFIHFGLYIEQVGNISLHCIIFFLIKKIIKFLYLSLSNILSFSYFLSPPLSPFLHSLFLFLSLLLSLSLSLTIYVEIIFGDEILKSTWSKWRNRNQLPIKNNLNTSLLH